MAPASPVYLYRPVPPKWPVRLPLAPASHSCSNEPRPPCMLPQPCNTGLAEIDWRAQHAATPGAGFGTVPPCSGAVTQTGSAAPVCRVAACCAPQGCLTTLHVSKRRREWSQGIGHWEGDWRKEGTTGRERWGRVARAWGDARRRRRPQASLLDLPEAGAGRMGPATLLPNQAPVPPERFMPARQEQDPPSARSQRPTALPASITEQSSTSRVHPHTPPQTCSMKQAQRLVALLVACLLAAATVPAYRCGLQSAGGLTRDLTPTCWHARGGAGSPWAPLGVDPLPRIAPAHPALPSSQLQPKNG